MDDLTGQKIIVCGGSGKMGKNICSYFEKLGAIPIIIDKTIEENKSNTSFECDLSNFDMTKLIFQEIFKIHPKINYLVNALRVRSKEEYVNNICDTSSSIVLELNAYLYPMHLFCNRENSGGCLVNVSSILGTRVSLDVPLDYHVAKAAIEQASRYYAAKYKEHNVRINCIAPGLISNGSNEPYSVSPEASYYSKLAGHLPLQRSGSHNEVAALIAFLLSDVSGFLLGTNIKIDGGGDLIELLSK